MVAPVQKSVFCESQEPALVLYL